MEGSTATGGMKIFLPTLLALPAMIISSEYPQSWQLLSESIQQDWLLYLPSFQDPNLIIQEIPRSQQEAPTPRKNHRALEEARGSGPHHNTVGYFWPRAITESIL
eukprot:747810-Hanusia_phi.AAC.9